MNAIALPSLKIFVRNSHRVQQRLLDTVIALRDLCPDDDCSPYEPDWQLAPVDDEHVALLRASGELYGTLLVGASLDVGACTLTIARAAHNTTVGARTTQHSNAPSSARTEQLVSEQRVSLAVVLPDGRQHVLGQQPVRVGKSPSCDIVLHDNSVSSLHCTLFPTRDGWEVRDENSTNGTRVEGVRVNHAVLFEGISLSLGRSRLMCIRAHTEGGASNSKTNTSSELLVGSSVAMTQVRSLVARFARSPYPVLILGETGSGKELVARMIHTQSARSKGPFVAINAGAIASELVESELFGHERGAFTGAAQRRRGVFEEAHGGTLFLDEIGELPLALQTRLLRVLETHEIRRVGGEGNIAVDVRIVCATHRDLPERAQTGTFRADLLYRLDLLRVELPPLRERGEDVGALAVHLLQRIAREMGRARKLSDEALAKLLLHTWPGNVRELYGVLCRAAVEADGPLIQAEHIVLPSLREKPYSTPHTSRPPPSGLADPSQATSIPPAPRVPKELSVDALHGLLVACGGNISRAAAAAGLPRSTFRERLRRGRGGLNNNDATSISIPHPASSENGSLTESSLGCRTATTNGET